MFVTLADGSRLECEDKAFAQGTEGELFWDKAGTHVIKLYKSVEPEREKALEKIIGSEYSVLTGNDKEKGYWQKLFAWPQAIIKQPRLGITMLRAPAGSIELQWFLFPKTRATLDKSKLGHWRNSIEVAIKMARVVRRMHGKGLCHSDLSFRNFLVNLATKEMMLIDCDGLVVPGFLPPNVLGTPGCIAPELLAQITSPKPEKIMPSIKTDLHALSALIYWLLFQRHSLKGPKFHDSDPTLDDLLAMGERALFVEHPQDKSNHNPKLPATVSYTRMLTEPVQQLVRQAFVDGLHSPIMRPHAAEWEQALSRMLDSLVSCPNNNCPLGEFVLNPFEQNQGKIQCPCGTALTTPTQLPILNFYRKTLKGQFQPDQGYIMVGQPGRTLYSWHAYTGKQDGFEMDDTPKAIIELNKDKWYIKNLDLPEMCLLNATNKKEIQLGQQVELTDKATLLLGNPDKNYRLVYVQMLKL